MVSNQVVNSFLGLPLDYDPHGAEKVQSVKDVQWTKDQQGLLDWFHGLMSDDSPFIATISGSAGSGKTFITGKLISDFKEKHSDNAWYRLAVMAPTNKAVRVLAEKLASFGFNLDYSIYTDDGKIADPKRVYIGTIHKFLRAIPNSNDIEMDDSELNFDLDSNDDERPINRMDVIFVDESSMIGEEFYRIISKAADHGCTVVFIGDQYQLFPVDNTYKVSPVFTDVDHKYNLTEVVRYDGMVLKVATQIRENMEDEIFNRAYSFRNFNLEELTVVRNKNGYQGTDWYKLLVDYASDQHSKGLHPDYVRALVYKRRTREILNNSVRFDLFGKDSINSFVKGEWLFTHSQCSSYIPLSERVALLRAREANDPGYADKREQMKDALIRVGNARDLKVVSCEAVSVPLECPTEDLDSVWQTLDQSASMVTVDCYLGEMQIAVLTEQQLKEFAANKQILTRFLSNQGYNSQLINDYLKQLNYCFNVAETNVKYVSDYEKDLVYHNQGYGKYPTQVKVGSKIQPGFVLTVHQSQGSGIDNAFIMYNDYFTKHPDVDPVDSMSLLYRLIYTALTRTKKAAKVFTKY